MSIMSKVVESFLYFGYGSNLCTERIRIHNPSAKFVAVAKLIGYSVVFRGCSHRWKGAVASIEANDTAEMYGVVWRIDDADSEALDEQEHAYERVHVKVQPLDDKGNLTDYITVRSYHKFAGEIAPPSPYYKYVIVRGAKEHSLPEEYIKMLQSIPDNNYYGDCADPQQFFQSHKNVL